MKSPQLTRDTSSIQKSFYTRLALTPQETVVLLVYIAVVAVGVFYYQQSMDEGREWVIARNFAIPHLVFHVLHHEGHPPLVYLLLWLPAHLGMPYVWINWLSALAGTGSAYLLLRLSPFPFYVRAVLPFCFALGYQEAVVARSYVLFPLLGFLVAHLYRSRPYRPVALAVALALLASVSFHGSLVAIGFALSYAYRLRQERMLTTRKPHALWWAGSILVTSLVMIAVCILPPKYSQMSPMKAAIRILHRAGGAETANATENSRVPQTQPLTVQTLSSAKPTTPFARPDSFQQRYATLLKLVFAYPISGVAVISYIMEFLIFVYLVVGKQWTLILPLAFLEYFLIFGFVDYRHTPLVWITLVLMLWAAWDTSDKPEMSWLQPSVALGVAFVCILQATWILSAIHYELHHATYPAKMTATYLKTLPRDTSIDGDKTAYAILPYMPASVPIDRGGGSYADIASYFTSATIDSLISHGSDVLLLNELLRSPEAIPKLHASGYKEGHMFCGGPYFPNVPIQDTCFHVFSRK